jgi:hypothetical protein
MPKEAAKELVEKTPETKRREYARELASHRNPTEGYIVYEVGSYFITRKGTGWYEVWENGITSSTRKGTFHFSDKPDYALQRAREKADQLASKSNPWWGSSSKEDEAPAKKRKRSGWSIVRADREAYAAGYKGKEHFDDWLERNHLEERGEPVKRSLRIAYEEGASDQARGLKMGGEVKSTGRGTSYKGYKIVKAEDGYVVPSLDKESRFEDVDEAKRFIASNPKKKTSGPISSTLRTIGGAGEFLDSQIGKVFNPKNPTHTFTGPGAEKAAKRYARLLEAEGKVVRVEKPWGEGWAVFEENPKKAKYTGPIYYTVWLDRNMEMYTEEVNEAKAWARHLEDLGYAKFRISVSAGPNKPPRPGTKTTEGPSRHFGGNPKRRNPEVTAADMYRAFHGKDSEAIEVFEEEEHYHGNLAELGQLIELKIITRSGLDAQLSFDTNKLSDQVLLCSNEDGTQMYLVGGDQCVDLEKLKMTGDWEKDIMVLGEVHFLSYMTEKDFDGFESIIYEHEVGLDEDARGKNKKEVPRPDLVYDTLNQKLSFAGGVYCIKKPLLETSRGIEK